MEPFSRRTMLLAFPATAAAIAFTGAGSNAAMAANQVAAKLTFSIGNKSGINKPLYLYVLGTDLASGRLGYVRQDGTFLAWPKGANPPSPAPDASIAGPNNGGTATLQVPKGISGRIYLAIGDKLDFRLTPDGLVQPDVANPSDPNRNVLFDFSEFTYNDGGLYLNSSQVDMFAVPHTVSLVAQDGSTRVAGTLVPQGRNNVIQQIKGLADWQRSVIQRSDGTVLRILAPAKAAVAGLMSTDYLDGEITRAWNAYTSKNLTIVPFGDRPNVKFFGRTSGNALRFTDTAGNQVASFNKPSTANVWNCDGNLFAPNDQTVGPIARTLGAALNRSTLVDFANQPTTDPSQFYRGDRTNHYARVIHANMADKKAYAFPFDDVANQESLVADSNPRSAGIEIGPFN